MDNSKILERLESLEALIEKTEPDIPDDRNLFSMHSIETQENIDWVRSIVTGNSNHDQDSARMKIIQIMKDSNRIWSIRNKIHNGEWDVLPLVQLEKEVKDFISQGQKISAIKHYRNVMDRDFGTTISLKTAKYTIDALAQNIKVDLTKGYDQPS